MKQGKRVRRGDEPVSVGDVVEVFDGPYGAAIVSRVDGEWTELERAHCHVSVVPADRTRGQLQIGIERIRVETRRAAEMPVWYDGAMPVNRAY